MNTHPMYVFINVCLCSIVDQFFEWTADRRENEELQKILLINLNFQPEKSRANDNHEKQVWMPG